MPPRKARAGTKSFTPSHFFIILCGVWLLVAAVLEVSLKLEAIAEKLERENDS